MVRGVDDLASATISLQRAKDRLDRMRPIATKLFMEGRLDQSQLDLFMALDAAVECATAVVEELQIKQKGN